jgi:glutamyl-tRNA synthetase
MSKVRVRFAPSPTGGLHLGGVRTVLYNYLFARRNGGDFILRIEDTDQSRYVAGAEQYIFDCLEWCGLDPDESTLKGGEYGPYRQSERKYLYYEFAQKLVDSGHAYYAFDTPEEIENMRTRLKDIVGASQQYDHSSRMQMRNSLTLRPEEVVSLLEKKTPYVIRIKVPPGETIKFTDMIRGEVEFNTDTVDDKVLLKADGMPTYHLAVVVDDHLMKITHAFRGEEWLSSAPVHLLLWKYLGWEDHMPQWAHLPLILKPDGHGKLSKRDGARLGFPVFAMNWKDPASVEVFEGFREKGFLPEAFVNMLALLGWNDGTEQEIFSMEEMIQRFSMDRVHKGGAKFDYEKAKWFNHQYLQKKTDEELGTLIKPYFEAKGVKADAAKLGKVAGLIKERCHLLSDFWEQGHFFFLTPTQVDLPAIKEKWNDAKANFFKAWIKTIDTTTDWTHVMLESGFNELAAQEGLKKGELLLPLRIMLVGGKYGPGVFIIAEMIGKEETVKRVEDALKGL